MLQNIDEQKDAKNEKGNNKVYRFFSSQQIKLFFFFIIRPCLGVYQVLTILKSVDMWKVLICPKFWRPVLIKSRSFSKKKNYKGLIFEENKNYQFFLLNIYTTLTKKIFACIFGLIR